jgi:ABC-type transport system involved in multi-copper enzyme maturation permease subunit
MLSGSVITRELRCASRSSLNYRLRVVVGAIAVFFVGAALSDQAAGRESGLRLFAALHGALVAVILLIGPVMTADAISRERREGTLDLLFLTPLTGTQVISSKFFSQGLRMVSLWLVSLPIAMVPVLAGGVGPGIVAYSLCVQLTCIFIGLVSGLTVSIYFRKSLAAVIGSVILSLFVLTFDFAMLIPVGLPGLGSRSVPLDCVRALSIVFGWPLFTPRMPGTVGGPSTNVMLIFGGNALLVACFGVLWLRVLGNQLSIRVQDQGESARAVWLRRVFLQPAFWKKALRRSMHRKMEANPLIWLEYRTAWSRSARSVTVAVLVLAESYVMLVAPLSREFIFLQMLAGFALVLLICVTAASSFQKEKENGAFELLLVAPLSEEKIHSGRLRAVWSYYRPAALVFVCFVLFSIRGDGRNLFDAGLGSGAHLLSVCLSGLTVPIAGLYFALKLRHFLQILASTAFFGILLPYFAWDFLQQIAWFAQYALYLPLSSVFRKLTEFGPIAVIGTLLIHGALINFFSTRTTLCLRTRSFAV